MVLRTHGEYARAQMLHKRALRFGPTGLPLQLFCGEADRLPESDDTVAALRKLGAAMGNDSRDPTLHTRIPAAFTYFGQLIDHDITTDAMLFVDGEGEKNSDDPIGGEKLVPLRKDQLARLVTNGRVKPLQLECLYNAPAEYEADGRVRLGTVTVVDRGIKTRDLDHDLLRRPMIEAPANDAERARDREAIIGDPRNDENVIISQMHCAFLRTHNALIKAGCNLTEAKRALRRRYQWAVLHDFLPRICDPWVLHEVLAGRLLLLKDEDAGRYLPLEFTGAAYRFGHSMIREFYVYNRKFCCGYSRATLEQLFMFTALSGDFSTVSGAGGTRTLPSSWIIDWPRFFEKGASVGENPTRLIDTRLERQLGRLTNTGGEPKPSLMGMLAARNLLRGYWLGLPTGQAVASFMGARSMSQESLSRAAPALDGDFEKNEFHKATPLWFYILAEAGDPDGPKGQHLGPIGSRIVAETIWSILKRSPESVLNDPPTRKELATGEFSLRGIIKMGQDPLLPPL